MAAPTVAQKLERLAGELHSIAFDFAEPSRSISVSEARIAEVERIVAEARAAVRGRDASRIVGHPPGRGSFPRPL